MRTVKNDQNEPGGVVGRWLWVVGGQEKMQIELKELYFDVKIAGRSGNKGSEENIQNEPKVKMGKISGQLAAFY